MEFSLEMLMLTVYQECFEDCIQEFVQITINGKSNQYFCKTCIRYMKSKRMPPMSVCYGKKYPSFSSLIPWKHSLEITKVHTHFATRTLQQALD